MDKLVAASKDYKSTKKAPIKEKKEVKPARKVGAKLDASKSAPKSQAKKLEVKKTIKKVQTKRGTGNTYKATWDANKGGVKSKYKTYTAFEKAAKEWNAKKDGKSKPKPKAKPKANANANTVSPNATRKKKLLSKNPWDKIPTGNKL